MDKPNVNPGPIKNLEQPEEIYEKIENSIEPKNKSIDVKIYPIEDIFKILTEV
jgi:hypothetical protein